MTESTSKNAQLQTVQTVKIPIPFFANLAALTNQTIVSSPISVHYKIVNVEAHFRDDSANNLQMYIFASNNRNAPVTTPPPDDNIISSLSPTPYLIGEGEIISLSCDYTPAANYQYIKVYFANLNAYVITGFCVVTIEAILQLQQPIDTDSAVFKAESEKETVTLQAKSKATVEMIADIMKGTPKWLLTPQQAAVIAETRQMDTLRLQGTELEFVENFVTPDMNDNEKAEAYKLWFAKLQNFQAQQQAGLAVENLVSSLFPSGIQIYKTSVGYYDKTFPISAFAGQMNTMVHHAAWGNALLHRANEIYMPNMPNETELINEVVKEVMSLEEFKVNMKKMGYADVWSQKIWDAHFIQPNYGDIVRATRRGTIKHDDIARYLKLVDLDPRYNDAVWYSLLEEVPAISDAINMRVKEVIDQPQFEGLLVNNGFSAFWGSKFWDAHFNPAQFMDFLTAMRRKETVSIPVANAPSTMHTFGDNSGKDIEIIKQLSILADYDPRYWDFFKTRMYNDPTPRMSQWAYEVGTLTKDKIKQLVHRFGYNDEDSTWYSEMLIHFQERPWIVKYLTALASAYVANTIDAVELKKRISAIPRNPEIADWIIKISDVRKEMITAKPSAVTEKLISLGELKAMRMRNMLSNEEFTGELMRRGYTQIDIDKLIELFNLQYEETVSGGVKEGLTIIELFDAFRYNLMDESTLTTNLMQRGMNLADINILIATKKAKWGVVSS